MFAIAFDLVVAEMRRNHPINIASAYDDIAVTLARFNFRRIQGSVYVCETEDLANLFQAIAALKSMPWFPPSARDARAFRVEQWSDFTPLMKQP